MSGGSFAWLVTGAAGGCPWLMDGEFEATVPEVARWFRAVVDRRG
ncbi:hypothetical protein VA596_17555 [Amycolatopsis sp., V23-08]|uniref:Uncharacterized protein n=1 Tax=Amycolatopsis heterodermiae TaxID=3110235 RepID=A0ABU5R6U2_9PSEU|nr:hypothetical protein [Amycolatopsis sp., V23-08]MEA5361354.1 hypothetical protein [Amycolatopsis sp., V23-08]